MLNQEFIKLHMMDHFLTLHWFFFGTALQLIGNTCVCDRYQTHLSLKNPNDQTDLTQAVGLILSLELHI